MKYIRVFLTYPLPNFPTLAFIAYRFLYIFNIPELALTTRQATLSAAMNKDFLDFIAVGGLC